MWTFGAHQTRIQKSIRRLKKMATLYVKDETYNRLARQAAAQNRTVEELIQPVLEQAAQAVFPEHASLRSAAE
jgi:hypothetical protein